MSPSNTVIIPENVLQSLKCVKCSLYISIAPVAYDNNENLVCGRCLKPNSTLRRARAFEKIQELLLFPCRYSSDGCPKMLNSSQMTLHEDVCEFGPLQCPMVPSGFCIWKGNSNQLYEHCLEYHNPSTHKYVCMHDFLQKTFTVWFHKISTYLFVINLLLDTTKKTITFTVHQIIKDDKQEHFDDYRIKFESVILERSVEICDWLDDYRKTRRKQKKKLQFDINIFYINDFFDDSMSVKIDIMNLTIQNEIASKYLENFKCPKCSLFMKTSIVICCNGHSFCNGCFIKSSICPTCTVECTGNKNLILQDIVKNSKFPCENEGCNYLGLENELKRHTNNCLFRKIQCPLKKITNCNWNGANNNHIRHLLDNHAEDYHKIRKVSGVEFKHAINLEDEKESYWIISYDNVYIRCCYQQVNKSCTWTFHQIGLSKKIRPLYKIEMEFISDGGNMMQSSLVVGIPCCTFRNEYSEDSFTVPYDCLSRYYIIPNSCVKRLMIRYNVVKINEYS